VFDFFVLPSLAPEDIAAVIRRTRRLDDDVRTYVQNHLSYRWHETSGSAEAYELERLLVTEGIGGSGPYINPGRPEAP
jgi:hypothetical protein